MRALVAMILGAFALGACASAYAPSSITGGFEERQISDTIWRVSYYANGYTSEETVQTYWLYRCAEIAQEQGYDGFRVASNVVLTSAPEAIGGARIVPVVESGMGKPFMVADIRLLRAPLPDEPGVVFSAAALRTFLEPYVHGELCTGNVCPHVHRYLFPGFNVEAPSNAS